MSLLRTKPIHQESVGLKKVLSAWDLTLLGIGCIIGTGIFVLTGIAAAEHSGPAIVLSFIVSGLACTFAALAYAELSSAIGGCGSAYGYAYAGLGEIVAWIIGWDLILEYGVATATVAIGWSRYLGRALELVGITLPDFLMKTPSDGGLINLPATVIVLMLAFLLALGMRESARFNGVIVFIKLLTVFTFIAVGIGHVDTALWHPFVPERIIDANGVGHYGWMGVMEGAALIFFAYIGFDAVSTAAEEAKNPQRDIPIGILGSLAVCTVLYIVVAAILTGIRHYSELNTASPLADALIHIGKSWGYALVVAGALAGLTTVMLVLYYGLTRVFLAMSRDGLLPSVFAQVNQTTGTPVRIIFLSGILIALVAGLSPINKVAELVNMGTLAAFVLVCASVIILRRTRPDMKRPFRTPGAPWTPVLGILFCGYLMACLPAMTWIAFGIWLAIGMVVYFTYSRSHSLLARAG